MPYNMCKCCVMNMPPRKAEYKERNVRFSSVFPLNMLHIVMGFKCSDMSSLFSMYKTYEEIEKKNPIRIFEYNNHPISNMGEIYEKIHSSIKSFYIEQECCDLCCDSNIIITKSCGRTNCEQKLCGSCATSWYGENKRGQLINLRHMTCMFCDRNPTFKIMKRWGSDNIEKMQTLPVIDSSMYYAWCIKCNAAKICAVRACAAEPPELNHFVCDDCVIPDTTPDDFKCCPKCEHPTILVSGCSHMTCHCGAHWCYECGKDFTEGTIYKHMSDAHGGWFHNAAYRNNYDDGYDTDDDYYHDH